MGVDDVIAPAAEALPPPRELPFEFRAKGGEYFRIWIVNLLLTIVTLGIYSAWAKVRRLRYFYGSTSLDGHSFDYHGRPIALLKGRIIAFVIYLAFVLGGRFNPIISIALLPVMFFGVPWVIMRARRFQMRMTSWRGLRFAFSGTYGGALGAFIGWPILGLLTLGILLPFAAQRQARYILANSSYGTQRFLFGSAPGRFYAFYILTLLIGIGVIVGAILVCGILMTAMGMQFGGFVTATTPQQRGAILRQFILSGGFLLPLVFALAVQVPASYFQASFTNASFGGLEIGPHRVRAQLKTFPLAWVMLSNLVATVCTLGVFYPWARVRLVRYQLANITVIANGDLGQFTAGVSDGTDAVGGEISDFFDLDFGF